MTEPQDAGHWEELYRRYVTEGVFDIRANEMQAAWAAMAPLFPTGSTILEVGCGVGLFLSYLVEQGHQAPNLAGVDIAQNAISMARHRMPEGEFHALHAGTDPLPWADYTFDIAFSGHTIEHVADPIPLLREMRRATKPDGRIILEFPFQDPPYVEHIHHMLDYDKVGEWLHEADIEIVECRPVLEMRPTNDGVVVGRRYGD